MTNALYVGLDVHRDTIAVAVAEEGRRGEIRFFGTIANKADSVLRLTKQLTASGKVPTFCYEAGPCGYGLHRHLTKLGFESAVVAPLMKFLLATLKKLVLARNVDQNTSLILRPEPRPSLRGIVVMASRSSLMMSRRSIESIKP